MPVDASSWALRQKTGDADAKFLLLMLSDRCGGDGKTYGFRFDESYLTRLIDLTEMPRERLLKASETLQRLGLAVEWESEDYPIPTTHALTVRGRP